MDDDLEARLESHAQAFEGLLSLIPAKQYYGEDNSDQWQRKKQTKEQKRAAKKAKLDPANQKTAKDVMDENEKKRKRELGMESDNESADDISLDGEREAPGEGLRKSKKLRTVDDKSAKSDTAQDDESIKRKVKADKRKEKREKKKEKVERKKEKSEAKKARKQDESPKDSELDQTADKEDAVDDGEGDALQADDLDQMDMSGLADEAESQSSAPTTPNLDSPAFDLSADQSTTSSSSSIIPPTSAPSSTAQVSSENPAPAEDTIKSKKEKAFNLPKIDPEELQSRLKARIEELRLRRKATGSEGQPARSRQELLEARRQKSEARKQHKKELRRKAKEEEERNNDERLRGSGSPLITDPFSPSHENNFSFGRVAFEDGAQVDSSLTGYFNIPKKNAQDPRTALQSAQKKAERLASMEDSKRADIEQKDLWLNAKKRAHGERIRDDQSLLKKALKRKEKTKLKSETEWNERKEGVRKGIETKVKKREDNLAKRREEKGSKKGKGKAKGGSKGGPKKKGRPGFEGRFKQ